MDILQLSLFFKQKFRTCAQAVRISILKAHHSKVPSSTRHGVISSSITHTLMPGLKKRRETHRPPTLAAPQPVFSEGATFLIVFFDGSQTKWHLSDMWGDRQIARQRPKRHLYFSKQFPSFSKRSHMLVGIKSVRRTEASHLGTQALQFMFGLQ